MTSASIFLFRKYATHFYTDGPMLRANHRQKYLLADCRIFYHSFLLCIEYFLKYTCLINEVNKNKK